MKKTLKPILSILLAFAMILPMCGVARAIDHAATAAPTLAATGTLKSPGGAANTAKTVTITATTTPTEYDGTYIWNVTGDGAAYVDQTNSGKTLTLTLKDTTPALATAANIAVTLTVQGGSDPATYTSEPCAVSIAAATVSRVALTTAGNATSVAVGGNLQATAAVTYDNGVVLNNPTGVVFTPASTTNLTVDNTGKIHGTAAGGPTNITATCGGQTSAPVSVTVTPGSGAAVTASAYSNTGAVAFGGLTNTSGISVYTQLYNAYQAAVGVAPTPGSTEITLTPLAGNGTVGSLSSASGYLSDLTSTVKFTPLSMGSFICNYSMKIDASNNVTGQITVNVSTSETPINITLPGSTAAYAFTAADASGVLGTQIISNAVGSTYTSIRFTSAPVATNNSGQSVGVLYVGSTPVTAGTEILLANVGGLTFIPTGYIGSYSVNYTAYNNSVPVRSGVLTIRVTNGSLNVSLNLNQGGAYTFSSKSDTASGLGTGSSAYELIAGAIATYGGLNAANCYISFDTPSSSVGTLYRTARALYSTDLIGYAELPSLYFIPAAAGTYQTTYRVYSTASTAALLGSGTLTIYVSTILGEADFSYTTTYGKTVTLAETDFSTYLKNKLGTAYTLTGVIFNDFSGSGTFYYGNAAFTPRASVTYYSRTYVGAPVNANTRYIDGVTFTAPNTAGSTSVSFTAYGVNAAGGSNSVSGVFHITYTVAAVPVVEFTAYNTLGAAAVTLTETPFANAYRTAMGVNTTATTPQFYIRLKNLPTYGALYQSYTSVASTGTQITSAMLSTTSWYVGGGVATRSVSSLAYIPLSNLAAIVSAYGTVDKVEYDAYSSAGALLYTGTIQFKLAANKSVSVTSDGLDFSLSDFYSGTDSDPILYVTFNTPLAGRLYVLSGTRMVPVTSTMRLYTVNPTDGVQPVSQLFFVPQYGQTAPVTLTYTAVAKSGTSYQNSIVVTPTRKTASERFNDIPAATASWAADSIDFASKYNLVQGTGNGKFEPNATMHRCDLVLILYRMAGSPAVPAVSSPYSDVTADKYYYASAVWAATNRIMDGVVTGDKYVPFGNITRQDYVRILYNYARYAGLNTSVSNTNVLSGYTDASRVATYATDAMKWAVESKYITSTDASRLVLSPDREATRAEIVTLLHRFLTY